MSVKIQGSSGITADVDSSGNLKTTSTLPSGASTEVTLAAIKAKTDNLDVLLSTRTKPADTQNVNIVSGLELEIKNDSGNPLAVSATSLPLPIGAATSAKQDTLQTALDSINTKTPTLASGRQPVDGSGVTQPISATSLPLPTGASTEITLAALNTKIPANPAAEHTTAASPNAARLSDGTSFYKATTPSDTQPVSQVSQPLPTGASTEATLSALNTKIPASPSQEHTAAGSPSSARLSDGTTFYKATTPSDTQPVSVASLPLPSGAATSAKQDTLQTAIDAINTKTPTPISGRQPVDGSGVVQPVSQNGNWTVTTAQTDEQTLTGVYYFSSTAFVVQAAADSATVGRCWLVNPIGSGVTVRVKTVNFSSQLGSALVAVTSPRITVERVTFTGTASGAQITPAKRKTSDANNIGTFRTASTGLTLSAGGAVRSFLPVASATAVGYVAPSTDTFRPDLNDRIDLAPGEGLVFRQADAGTTSDTRRYTFDLTVEEF